MPRSLKWPDIKFPPINLWSVWNRLKPCRGVCKRDPLTGACMGCGRRFEDEDKIVLSPEDQRRFVEDILRPPAQNEAFRRAVEEYKLARETKLVSSTDDDII